MAVRSVELFMGRGTFAAPNHVLYTVPAGRRTIVKHVAVFNFAATAEVLYVGVRRSGVDYYFARHALAANTALAAAERVWWLVLEEGDSLLALTDAAPSDWQVHVSGTELVL